MGETKGLQLPNLLALCRAAAAAAGDLLARAIDALRPRLTADGRLDAAALEAEQHAAHGLAWFATYAEGLRQMAGWGERLDAAGKLGERESLILQAAFGEYLAQIYGGIQISPTETARPRDIGLTSADVDAFFRRGPVKDLIDGGNTNAVRMCLAALIEDGDFGDRGLGDETLELIAAQFRRFTDEQITPHAHGWHLADALIPDELIDRMAALGVFGLTIPEQWGGLEMGKTAIGVVTEELSRGYLGVGSLATRSEIAAELIGLAGTDAQKQKYLPGIASGEILPTAVFTEPDNGSDLAGLRTRAVKDGGVYKITGAKTWITHAGRSDLMTLLARTDAGEKGYRGLSMFLAEKPRGTDECPFPAAGMAGGEIGVLGYRGMKEFEIAFDGFEVPEEALLGAVEGQGFKQLMKTFEAARIQTAARAVGVAQNALELGLAYARQRIQFAKPIYSFPRIAGKLAWMAVETMIARQLTYFAGRRKDLGKRCDAEAGMAKLLAARVAWTSADSSLQIHGGNGYALEYPVSRLLCDARVLNIFEGAAEIQAQVIARGLISQGFSGK
ncbi:MAG TPA: acyl-CoA dehydrogenase [Alphaproteobacteria bacterium]|nr:acyl-CoA dehydrogenase [Alphaproteobacteria bacterium]